MTRTSARRVDPSSAATDGATDGGATPSRRRAVALALLGGLAVLLVMLVQRPGTPPLYDGVGFPDEPYRWAVMPPGTEDDGAVDPPTTAQGDLRVEGDRTSAAMISSKEQGPQVAVFVNQETLVVPPGVTGVRVSATPGEVPPGPEGTSPVSNLYTFTATPIEGSGEVVVTPGKPVLVNLRANRAIKAWVVLHRWTGTQWQQVPTFQVGTDVYAASLSELGQYALLRMDSGNAVTVQASEPRDVPEGYEIGTPVPASAADDTAAPPGLLVEPDSGVAGSRLWLGLGLAALVLGGGLLLARGAARRQTAETGPDAGDPPAPR